MTRIEIRTADREFIGYINIYAPVKGTHDLLDKILVEGINQGGFLTIVECKEGNYDLECSYIRHGHRIEQTRYNARGKKYTEATA